jgi:hypothetical protein
MLSTGGAVSPGVLVAGDVVADGRPAAAVTSSRMMALKAAWTPSVGKQRTSSIWSAVSPRAPTRAIAKAPAMLSGEITVLLAGSALTR